MICTHLRERCRTRAGLQLARHAGIQAVGQLSIAHRGPWRCGVPKHLLRGLKPLRRVLRRKAPQL